MMKYINLVNVIIVITLMENYIPFPTVIICPICNGTKKTYITCKCPICKESDIECDTCNNIRKVLIPRECNTCTALCGRILKSDIKPYTESNNINTKYN